LIQIPQDHTKPDGVEIRKTILVTANATTNVIGMVDVLISLKNLNFCSGIR